MNTYYEIGQLHVRMALDNAFEQQKASAAGAAHLGKSFSFCNNPAEYDWKYIGKKELPVPFRYNMPNQSLCKESSSLLKSHDIHWEKHSIWIVDGVLHRGESDILPRRTFYIEEDTWLILWGEGYDLSGNLVKWYLLDACSIEPTATCGRWYRL